MPGKLRNMGPKCGCCCGCRDSDVLLLVDTTGSMQGFIDTLKTIFTSFKESFQSDSCRWSVVEYKDVTDGTPFSTDGWRVVQNFTQSFDPNIVNAVNGLSANGGGDLPEQAFSALKNAGEQWEDMGGRPQSDQIKRIIVWGGDAPSHNGGASYPTRSQVIDALCSACIKVFALNVNTAGAGLDGSADTDNEPHQAQEITDTTRGKLFNDVDPSDQKAITDALCEALGAPKTAPCCSSSSIGTFSLMASLMPESLFLSAALLTGDEFAMSPALADIEVEKTYVKNHRFAFQKQSDGQLVGTATGVAVRCQDKSIEARFHTGDQVVTVPLTLLSATPFHAVGELPLQPADVNTLLGAGADPQTTIRVEVIA
jgi:von Willebrand factor type A domain